VGVRSPRGSTSAAMVLPALGRVAGATMNGGHASERLQARQPPAQLVSLDPHPLPFHSYPHSPPTQRTPTPHPPSAESEALIFLDSSSRLPTAPVTCTRSLPARSTRFSLPTCTCARVCEPARVSARVCSCMCVCVCAYKFPKVIYTLPAPLFLWIQQLPRPYTPAAAHLYVVRRGNQGGPSSLARRHCSRRCSRGGGHGIECVTVVRRSWSRQRSREPRPTGAAPTQRLLQGDRRACHTSHASPASVG